MPRDALYAVSNRTSHTYRLVALACVAALSIFVNSGQVLGQMVAEPDSAQPSNRSRVLEQQQPSQLDTIRRTAQPFGHSLFSGGFGTDQSSGLNADYIVDVGDRVAVRIWGAASFDSVQTVDSQGNIFIPEVGPVRLSGVANKYVNTTVKKAVSLSLIHI